MNAMKHPTTLAISMVFALAMGGSALAKSDAGFSSSRMAEQVVHKLEQKAQDLWRSAQTTKGWHRAKLRIQSRRARNLADQIKAGEPADSGKVDQLLR